MIIPPQNRHPIHNTTIILDVAGADRQLPGEGAGVRGVGGGGVDQEWRPPGIDSTTTNSSLHFHITPENYMDWHALANFGWNELLPLYNYLAQTELLF